jgi:hypothetical protein
VNLHEVVKGLAYTPNHCCEHAKFSLGYWQMSSTKSGIILLTVLPVDTVDVLTMSIATYILRVSHWELNSLVAHLCVHAANDLTSQLATSFLRSEKS